MKQMPKKVSKIMFCFTTCTPKIEKVQIWSRVTFASIKAKKKKNTKKNVFFYTVFFAFCLDLRWTRTFWTGFRMLSWLLDLSMYDRSNHAEATISTLSFQKLQTFLEFWTYCATFFSSKCHFEPQSLIYHNKWLSWAFLAPEDDFYLFLKNFW